MYTIVGLGNPGPEHTRNRHNTGRIIISTLSEANRIGLKEVKKPPHRVGIGDIGGDRARLVLPDTFMNKSGAAVLKYVKSAQAARRLIIVHDDIDLPLGKVRVSMGSSSAGHNGIKSIERAVRSKDFIKIRVGVSKPIRGKAKKPSGERAVLDHLLGDFTKGELEAVCGLITERVLMAISTILSTGDPVRAMNTVNGLPVM